ncbi:MAG: hypothetical protein HYV90_05185 [Candidatus Woesebacteria bacterium]|nr:MAG: hypothetical protein HYV90_05185 [Candidatus Woesebacteria bacterium]
MKEDKVCYNLSDRNMVDTQIEQAGGNEIKQAPPHYVITVEDFYSGHYADKITQGECVVGKLFGEPKREDYDSEAEYQSNQAAFDLVIKINPTGNLQTFNTVEKQGDYYLMTSFDKSGGVGTMPMSGDEKLLVFSRTPKLSSGS